MSDVHGGGREPSEEEMAAAVAEQIASMRVEQLVASALETLVMIGFGRAERVRAGEAADLGQVQLAIEAIRGLLPVAERFVPAESLAALRDALAQLQMVFAAATGAPAPPPPGRTAAGPGPAAPGAGPPPPPRRERPTIWTPGGER